MRAGPHCLCANGGARQIVMPRVEPLDAFDVAALLDEIGQRLELAGESPFKSRAYFRAAESLRALSEPLAHVVQRGELRAVPGVGEAIAEKIDTMLRTGTHRTLDRLRQEYPPGVLELLAVPGLKPDRAGALHRKLGIAGLSELEAAARAGKLRSDKEFGAWLEAKVLEGIALARARAVSQRIDEAYGQLQGACAALVAAGVGVLAADISGQARRGCEVVDELVVTAVVDEGTDAPATFHGARVVASTRHGYPFAQLYSTGAPAHIEQLEARAASIGLTLSPRGLASGSGPVRCRDESDVYAALQLQYVAPELRDGRGEVEMAASSTLPALIALNDVRGILHSHTSASDGTETLADMAEATRILGCEYYGVADHSQLAAYAGGLSEERVREQHRLADRLNDDYRGTGFRILKGIECDIRSDGSLDFPDAVLAAFDFVVASVHSRFTLDREAQTARIVRAVSNTFTTILGHPTGRLLLRRPEYALDIDAVMRACADHGVAIEINADPHRLDLDWRHHRRALDLGCNVSIDPDAHSIAGLATVRWGVLVARKGGVPPERNLTCWGLEKLGNWLAERRHRAARAAGLSG